ncbi:NRDE family protein [Spirillospora sp. CA-294931]|uniref:NRDE family protein n=1 Tax=Spirillospora sp. CA-294931 TaxID=3240042 RepID=UPI003D94BBE8
MCTAIVSIDPSSPVPVLIVGVRDEFIDRAWVGPGRHWPDRPGVIGGRDLRAGGTWLAVEPAARRVATVLNGHGPLAPEAGRISRGELPLRLAADGKLGELEPERFDPFHLIGAEPGAVRLWSWNGAELTERELGPGLHLVVNSGLEGEGPVHVAEAASYIDARLAHFRPRLEAAPRPVPLDGDTAHAWGAWLPLVDGDGLERSDKRALIPLIGFEDGKVWGTTSLTLAALSADGVRYDFSTTPGDPTAWTRVPA